MNIVYIVLALLIVGLLMGVPLPEVTFFRRRGCKVGDDLPAMDQTANSMYGGAQEIFHQPVARNQWHNSTCCSNTASCVLTTNCRSGYQPACCSNPASRTTTTCNRASTRLEHGKRGLLWADTSILCNKILVLLSNVLLGT